MCIISNKIVIFLCLFFWLQIRNWMVVHGCFGLKVLFNLPTSPCFWPYVQEATMNLKKGTQTMLILLRWASIVQWGNLLWFLLTIFFACLRSMSSSYLSACFFTFFSAFFLSSSQIKKSSFTFFNKKNNQFDFFRLSVRKRVITSCWSMMLHHMPKEWRVSNMNAHDPIRWWDRLISYSHGENHDQIHWQSLRSHVAFLHSKLTGFERAPATTATS